VRHAEKKRKGGGASHAVAGEGEREAGQWAGPWGVVQLAVGREGMTGGPDFKFNPNSKIQTVQI
jgi:hypothetical protein